MAARDKKLKAFEEAVEQLVQAATSGEKHILSRHPIISFDGTLKRDEFNPQAVMIYVKDLMPLFNLAGWHVPENSPYDLSVKHPSLKPSRKNKPKRRQARS